VAAFEWIREVVKSVKEFVLENKAWVMNYRQKDCLPLGVTAVVVLRPSGIHRLAFPYHTPKHVQEEPGTTRTAAARQ
jgi:hypothetical protein